MAEQEYDFSDFSFNELNIEEEKEKTDQTVQSKTIKIPEEVQNKEPSTAVNYDFSGFSFEDDVVSMPVEDDSWRQYQYGLRQQRTFTGHALNYVDAALDSMFDSDITLKEALAENEAERNAEIWMDYPEWKGLLQDQETLEMLAGRLTVDLADPVTFALPAYKYAKAGSAAKSILWGAGFGGADGFLRGQAEGSDSAITDTTVGTAFGAGAGSVAVLGVKTYNALKNTISKRGLETIKETMETTTTPNSPPTKVYPEVDSPDNIPEQLSLLEEENLEAAVKRNVTTEKMEKIVEASPAIKTGVTPVVEIEKVLNKLTDDVAVLKSKNTKEAEEQLKILEPQLKEVEEKFFKAQQKYVGDQLNFRLAKVDANIDIMEDMSLEGTLTDKILHHLFYSATRPVVGGLAGYAASGLVTDGSSSDDNTTLGFVLAGASIGAFNRYLQGNTITKFDREKLSLLVDNEQALMLKRNINLLVSGGLSSRLESTGGWAKVVGNLLFDTIGNATDSIESKVNRNNRAFMTELADNLGDTIDKKNASTRKVIGEVLNGFVEIEDVKAGYKGITNDYKALTQEQVEEVKRLFPIVKAQQTKLADSVEAVGIKFKKLDDFEYGITQLYDIENISKDVDKFKDTVVKALKIEYPNKSSDDILEEADEFVHNLRGTETFKEGNQPSNVSSLFDVDNKFRPLTNHFEKHRLINNPQARYVLAKEGFLDLDVMNTMSTYAERSIKARDFAEVFGPNGEFLKYVFNDIDTVFKDKKVGTSTFGNKYKKDLIDAVNTFWGVKDLDPTRSKAMNVPIALATTLANTNYLTRVTISSLGDLVQPFQNSGFYSGFKALAGKIQRGGSFSKQAGFKYDGAWEKDFSAMMAHGDDPLDTFRNNVNKFNKGFFNFVMLPKLTSTARAFAYDTGVYRAFDLSKKKSLGRARLKELQSLGLSTEQLNTLKQFKTAKQAFNSDEGRAILDVAGQRAADRDALIPGIGNRAMFTQSRNPLVRTFGQFYSWAQAKASQTNSLVKRIENRDAALAVRLLGLTTVYNGIQHLRNISSPSYDPHAEQDSKYFKTDENLKKAMLLSGNFLPYQADEIISTMKYKDAGWNSASASMGYTSEALLGVSNMVENIAEGDYEGIRANALPLLPFGKEYMNIRSRIEPDYSPPRDYDYKATGGVIKAHTVPNAKAESEETIDKMTGLPYDVQAGAAHVDVEDRSPNLLGTLQKRQGKTLGGVLRTAGKMIAKTDLGKEIGETVGEAVDTAKDFVSKTEEKLVKEFDDITKSINKGETPEVIEEEKVIANVDDTIKPYKFVPTPATYDEMFGALDKGKKDRINIDMPEGEKVELRLDIPAYNRHNVWVPTIHYKVNKLNTTSHRATAAIKNVDFSDIQQEGKQRQAEKIRDEVIPKGPFAKIKGNLINRSDEENFALAQQYLKEMNTPASRRQTKAETAFIKDLYSSRADWQEFLEEMNYEVSIDENYNLLMKPTLDNVNALNKYFSSYSFEDDPLPPRMRFGRLSESGRFADQWMPEWTQVGFNPKKHSYFFDRETGDPVIAGEEALQVGPLVLVKNAVIGNRKDFKFAVGGLLNTLKRKVA